MKPMMANENPSRMKQYANAILSYCVPIQLPPTDLMSLAMRNQDYKDVLIKMKAKFK